YCPHACFWPQLSANTWTLLGDNVKYAGRNWPLSRPREVPRSMDSSCPGLTRASIEKKRFFQGGVDCRVKLGNDGVGSEIGSKSFAVSDDPRMTDCEFLKR